MEFRVLGSLEVLRDDVLVVPGSFKQRSLLALLLIHANQVVSTDRIIDELWGDDLVPGRQNALWVHISNLRSALEPNRPPRSEGTVLLTRPPGYLLDVDPRMIDAHHFERLVEEGRRLLEVDPSAASLVLGEGLTLWRGRAYADVMMSLTLVPARSGRPLGPVMVYLHWYKASCGGFVRPRQSGDRTCDEALTILERRRLEYSERAR